LASQWSAGGYDIRWLYRTVLNTRAYQSEAAAPKEGASASETPEEACPARLRADQILDTLAQVLDLDPEGRSRELAEQMAKRNKGNPQAALAARRFSPRNQFNTVFGVDPSLPADEVVGTIPQALLLMNGQLLQRAMEARPRTMLGRLLAEHRDDAAAIEALYLKVLARKPNAEEARIAREHIGAAGNRSAGYEDLLWALVNSAEFVSRR
jgi:hypothetical protein